MEIKKILLRKEMKLVTLLLTSLLIATASATVYYSLTMQPRVTVSTPLIKFSQAPDNPTGSTVNDAWVRLNATSYPNATLTYEKALYINNTDSSSAHSFMLRHVDISPKNNSDVGNWVSIKFLVYNTTGYVFSLNYTVTSDIWYVQPGLQTNYYSIPASTGWWIRLETRSPATATTTKVCDIQISVDVQK